MDQLPDYIEEQLWLALDTRDLHAFQHACAQAYNHLGGDLQHLLGNNRSRANDIGLLQQVGEANWLDGLQHLVALIGNDVSQWHVQRTFDSIVSRHLIRQDWPTLRYLLPMVDPKADNSQCLWMACCENHSEAFDILLPLSDPTAGEGRTVITSAFNVNFEFVERLLPYFAPGQMEEYLHTFINDPDEYDPSVPSDRKIIETIENMIALLQHRAIEAAIEYSNTPTAKRKI